MKSIFFTTVLILLCGLTQVSNALPLTDVYAFMFPNASQEVLTGNAPRHAMYHKGRIIFTPLGQLDGLGVISKNFKGVMVAQLDESSSLAKAGLRKFDIITGIDGQELSAIAADSIERLTPAVELSRALMLHERKGGMMVIRYERGLFNSVKKRRVLAKVKINKLGSFSSYLKTGRFTGRDQRLSEQALNVLLKSQRANGSWKCSYGSQLSSSLAGIHLIMLADRFPKRRKEIMDSLKKISEYLKVTSPQWLWDMGMNSWFFAEYFWATGDISAYESLHESIARVDNGINPLGGVCHKPLVAPYGNINMGGPYGLVALGFKAMESCRTAYNRQTTSQLMDYHVLGFRDTSNCNAVSYPGGVHKSNHIGASGFRTAAYMTAWHRYPPRPKKKSSKSYQKTTPPKKFAKEKQVIVANMHALLQKYTAAVSNIHATPAFGTIFTSLAFSTFAVNSKEAIKNSLMANRLEQLVLSLDSKGQFHYVYPRSSRMAMPGGGGWNGDGIMGLNHLATITAISFLNSSNKNLLVNAPPKARRFCWLSGLNSKSVWKKVSQFHYHEMNYMVKEIKTALKNKEREKSLELIDNLRLTYPKSMFQSIHSKDVKKMLAIILKQIKSGKFNTENVRRRDAEAFLKKVYPTDYKKVEGWMGFINKVLEPEKAAVK